MRRSSRGEGGSAEEGARAAPSGRQDTLGTDASSFFLPVPQRLGRHPALQASWYLEVTPCWTV